MFVRNVRLILASLVSVVALNGVAHAQNTGTSSGSTSVDWPYDLHNYSRAVAFGSIQLAGDNTDEWKKVEADNFCAYPMPMPLPGDGNSTGTKTATTDDGDSLYCWSVYVTKTYDLKVCDDGRAFILRSGIGISLEDRHNGQSFQWDEADPCTIYSQEKTAKVNGMNKDRPLDFQHLARKPL